MLSDRDRLSALVEGNSRPSPEELVETLLTVEREAKKAKETVDFDQLIGTWRLRFITGTRKAKDKAGIVLGSGRYLPRWVKIYLAYTKKETLEAQKVAGFAVGDIINQVELGSLRLSLSGPARFFHNQRLLAFDFTRMTVTLFGVTLYSGYVRGGELSESNFYGQNIKKQAFFAYFLISERAIAARGRGGGLALWVRESASANIE